MRDYTIVSSQEGTGAPTSAPKSFHGQWEMLLSVAALVIVVLSITVANHVSHAALWDVCAAVIVCWIVAGRVTFTSAPRLGWVTSAGALAAATR